MGIRKKIIKKLPIFGRGQAQAVQQSMSQQSPSVTESASPVFEPPSIIPEVRLSNRIH